jgi:hypothetical protein
MEIDHSRSYRALTFQHVRRGRSGFQRGWALEFQIVLWALAAVLLYRFWPLKTDSEQSHIPVEAQPNLAR